MILRHLVFALFVAGLAACFEPASRTQTDEESPGNMFSPLRVAMTLEEVDALGLPSQRRVASSEGEQYEEVTVTMPQGPVVLTLAGGRVFELSTTSSGFRTRDGAFVGLTLGELTTLYPEGRLVSGFAEGGYFSFIPETDPGVFQFDVAGLSQECLVAQRSCPANLTERQSVRYYVQGVG